MNATPPYYAVIFTSRRSAGGEEEYAAMSEAMEELARQQPGFLGMEHAREAIGITVSYWDTLESIARWKSQADHKVAQQLGRQSWYESYRVRICRVERSYGFPQEHP
jgi:heme-degrading monooxygenase HmoA